MRCREVSSPSARPASSSDCVNGAISAAQSSSHRSRMDAGSARTRARCASTPASILAVSLRTLSRVGRARPAPTWCHPVIMAARLCEGLPLKIGHPAFARLSRAWWAGAPTVEATALLPGATGPDNHCHDTGEAGTAQRTPPGVGPYEPHRRPACRPGLPGHALHHPGRGLRLSMVARIRPGHPYRLAVAHDDRGWVRSAEDPDFVERFRRPDLFAYTPALWRPCRRCGSLRPDGNLRAPVPPRDRREGLGTRVPTLLPHDLRLRRLDPVAARHGS